MHFMINQYLPKLNIYQFNYKLKDNEHYISLTAMVADVVGQDEYLMDCSRGLSRCLDLFT